MSVRTDNGVIYLEGDCPVEEAEILVQALESIEDPLVDLTRCRHPHGAVVQVLLTFNPQLSGAPEDPFLRDHLAPALQAAAGRSGVTSDTQDAQI